jgi:hypothetical protein
MTTDRQEGTMNALLGKITHINQPEGTAAGNGAGPLEVKFKPACVLPRRNAVPEWLKDQSLTLRRAVPDPRELGEPGDSLVLTPVESAHWLYPLSVTPAVAYGRLPETLQLRLAWWKDEKLPEFTVRANGRTRSGQFTKEGDVGVATVETAPFFGIDPALPVAFEITCDKMKVACTVLPENEPCARKLLSPEGEQYRLENAWYGIDITGRSRAGALTSFQEKGRGVDHFRAPENLIHHEGEHAGHLDRLRMGWDWGKTDGTAMTCSGARRDAVSMHLSLEGVVDEGEGLRTRVDYSLYDALPLLLWERTFQFSKGKGGEKKDDKDEKPKELIDDLKSVKLGFRAAYQPDRNGATRSRLLCADGKRLAAIRPALTGEHIYFGHWRIVDGWAMAEHPGRQEYSLYLFDRQSPPNLATALGAHTITLEPEWPQLPVRPDEVTGFSVALTAGEIAGASVEGAWVACRSALPDGGVRAALVGRLRDEVAPANATFTLGDESSTVTLQGLLLPGIGMARFATVDFPEGRLDQPFAADLDRVARRR